MTTLRVELVDTSELWFGPRDPVRAASGIAPWGDGWLVVQDDAVDAAWWRPAAGGTVRMRLLPPRDGHVLFSEQAGTKHLKPDLEAACAVQVRGRPGVVLLGSGSLPARTHVVVVHGTSRGAALATADLAPLYERVERALDLQRGQLNLEGACVAGDALRWFQRGHGASGVRSASVDVEVAGLLASVLDGADPAAVPVSAPTVHPLGEVEGVALGITDAVALPHGHVLVSAAAEDTPDAVADGPVTGSALVLLGTGGPGPAARLGGALAGCKVEGLACIEADATSALVLAVVDQDDPEAPSRAVRLRVHWA